MAGRDDGLFRSPPALSRIEVNTNKAGMEGLDKTKINQIILEASKGSKYYENELQKDKKVSERIQSMLLELKKVTLSEKQAAETACDKEIQMIELSRQLNHIIVHIDMDAFYAAVEMRDDPSLINVPMAVGGNAMLSTSNYVARKYGVRAGMPGFIAKKLCPNLVIVKSNFAKYEEVSKEIREILANYDPLFAPMGLDEAYLDLTHYILQLDGEDRQMIDGREEELFDDDLYSRDDLILSEVHWDKACAVVSEIRQKIFDSTQLTASAGIAVNKMLAKIASDMNKPDGQFFVKPTREEIMDFIRNLAIRKICGIGKVTEKMLNALNVHTCNDLYEQRSILRLLFSKSSSEHFLNISMGVGSSTVHSEWERKSISTERTFPDISKPDEMFEKCRQICTSLAEEVAENQLKGKTVTLKLKTSHFEVKQRSMSFPHYIHSFDVIYKSATNLLENELQSCENLQLRLMGVRLSGLEKCSRKKRQRPSNTLDRFFSICDKRTKVDEDNLQVENELLTNQHEEEDDGGESNGCPICQRMIPGGNVGLNQHIDECLNHSTIQEMNSLPPISQPPLMLQSAPQPAKGQTCLTPTNGQTCLTPTKGQTCLTPTKGQTCLTPTKGGKARPSKTSKSNKLWSAKSKTVSNSKQNSKCLDNFFKK